MSVEDERRVQTNNKCWIYKTLFTDERKKRDNDIWWENIEVLLIQIVILILNLLTKFPWMFHNWRIYDDHLIMQEISKSDVKSWINW